MATKDSLLKHHLWSLITYTLLLGVRVAPFLVLLSYTDSMLVSVHSSFHTHSHTCTTHAPHTLTTHTHTYTHPLLQGHHSRSRSIPRTVHITPSVSVGSLHGSHTHLNGHAEHSPKHSSGESVAYDSKKRLQPIGADAKPKTIESSRANGFVKRTSLVMENTSLKGSHSSLTLSSSQGSRKSSSSSIADQANTDTQFLPPIV